MYEAFELNIDDNVFQMLKCKCSFSLNTIIELYVTFTRSTEAILSLLTPNTPFSSSNFIPTSLTIIYYDGPLRGPGITESSYGFGQEFNLDTWKTFEIRHDCNYN